MIPVKSIYSHFKNTVFGVLGQKPHPRYVKFDCDLSRGTEMSYGLMCDTSAQNKTPPTRVAFSDCEWAPGLVILTDTGIVTWDPKWTGSNAMINFYRATGCEIVQMNDLIVDLVNQGVKLRGNLPEMATSVAYFAAGLSSMKTCDAIGAKMTEWAMSAQTQALIASK